MRHWWVNQNQTYRHEIAGGYLWSPKRNANNARNQFYDFMRDVAPGDVVLSFAGTYIRAIGIVVANAYLLLTPDADHLFDRGYVSFDDNGGVLWSPVAHVPSLLKMGLDPSALKNAGGFSDGQKRYLAFHRESVFLQSGYKY